MDIYLKVRHCHFQQYNDYQTERGKAWILRKKKLPNIKVSFVEPYFIWEGPRHLKVETVVIVIVW
jgi:hypothetical protein